MGSCSRSRSRQNYSLNSCHPSLFRSSQEDFLNFFIMSFIYSQNFTHLFVKRLGEKCEQFLNKQNYPSIRWKNLFLKIFKNQFLSWRPPKKHLHLKVLMTHFLKKTLLNVELSRMTIFTDRSITYEIKCKSNKIIKKII